MKGPEETKSIWRYALVVPLLTFISMNMAVWRSPQILGGVALTLLEFAAMTVLFVLAAIVALIYFAAHGLIYWKKEGNFVRQMSRSLACLCFIGLTFVAVRQGLSLRHQAFIEASRIGDRIVQALAQYRKEKGEYPQSLSELQPEHLKEIPYTGMIAYPEFTYRKDYNDIQAKPGEYELWINCTLGLINFDRFIYWPSEDYPDRIQGNRVERIRAWAYIHE